MSTQQPNFIEEILMVLAVLESGSDSTVAALLHRVTAREVDERLLTERLATVAAVEVHGNSLSLDATVAATRREALLERDFLHFRRLHEAALAILAPQLHGNPFSLEQQWLRVFTRLAEALLNRDTVALRQLTETWEHVALSDEAQPHYTFYRALAAFWSGNYAQTLILIDAVLAAPTVALPLRSRAINVTALCHYYQGQWQQALDGYRHSLALAQRLADKVQEGKVRLNMGVIYYELHDYAEAEAQLVAAETLFHAANATTWLASVHHELALIYRQQGQWQHALAYFQRCIDHRLAEEADELVGMALNNVGEIWLLQENLPKAQEAFQQALARTQTPTNRIDVLTNIGLYHEVGGEATAAQQRYAEAMALVAQTERREMAPLLHYRLGTVALAHDAQDIAWTHWLHGIELIEANREPMHEEALKISLLGRWQQIYEAMVALAVDRGEFAEALAYTEQARARAFLERITASQNRANLAAQQPWTVPQIQARLSGETALISYFATGQPGTNAALLANLPATSTAIRRALLPPARLFAFIITNSTVHAIKLPVDLEQLQAQYFHRATGRLRGVTVLPGRPLPSVRRWQMLGRQLLMPLTPYLMGMRHLCLIPHGPLHYLPLHALVDVDQLTQVAGTTVSYAPSASILCQTEQAAPLPAHQAATAEEPSALAIGVNAEGLAHAEAEATWIAQLLHGESLTGTAATATQVLAALGEYRLLHFSCHGHFRQRDPMHSALQLHDGELTADMLLRSASIVADLVTLSACDTGLNDLHPGDELMGLTRAFLGSGARSLLVSLWPVHEVPTRLLMEHFYSQWQRGVTKAMALRLAQQFVATLDFPQLNERLASYGVPMAEHAEWIATFQQMTSGDHPFAHPYYWAAFFLTGHFGSAQ
ncbi:MAG: CHAT domain-containing protein [Caldilineaceae bacterium]|nr:CHAT domain-containing protein [Caldilineaceae bacterium]